MLLKLPKEPRLCTFHVCTNDHKEFNGVEIVGEPLAIGVKKPKSKVNTYIIKEGYTYLWETYTLCDGKKFYSIWLLYPKNNRPNEIEIENYSKKEIIDAFIYETKIKSNTLKQIDNSNTTLTLLEIISTMRNGDSYIPIEKHVLLNKIYMENDFIIFDFNHDVPHIGLGINKNMKFKKLD